jgi:tetratricopeptide (TPR) repeat protein
MRLSKLQQAAEFFNMNDLVQAERLYKETIVSQPECGQAYLGMGVIALKVEQFDNAITFLSKSCELLTNEASPLIYLSEAFNAVHFETDGLTALEYAAHQLPNNPSVHYHLGLQYIMFGVLTKAEQSFRAVIRLSQDTIASYALQELTRLNNNSEQYLPLLEKRLEQAKPDSQESIVLQYALGNVFDSNQNYQLAWQYFEKANLIQAKQNNFETSKLQDFFQDIKTTATANVLSIQRDLDKANSAKEVIPIFILGLPRTGSTLLEQLLSEHQDVSSAGEVPYLSREVAKYLFSQTKAHYPYLMADITKRQIDGAALIYLEKMSIHAKGNRYVIDKLPANFQSIGLIYKLFPNAKVLHITRDLPDVALSIYRNNFSQNEPYFSSLKEFKQYHSLYDDLMQHWNIQLPNFIHEVSYEKLVLDKTNTISEILSFCGLPPQIEDCNKTQNKNVVKTLSNIQVRGAISTKSIKNWHNYAQHLSLFNKSGQVT